MKTASINVQTLCVPCANRCRYCLLSYDGHLPGAPYERSKAYAARFHKWLQENRPDLSFAFYWGYSMEHPQLLDAIDFAASIGSPAGAFLQFDGMAFRSENQLLELLQGIRAHGVKLIDLTFYGTKEYHDRFAARRGDFDYMMAILSTAHRVGLDVQAGIPMTKENLGQLDELIGQLAAAGAQRVFCFVPHSEGRGAALDCVRITQEDLDALSPLVKRHFNSNRFRTESQWLLSAPQEPQRRVLTLSLTQENMAHFEALPFEETISFLEHLDDSYHTALPSFSQLLCQYADPNSTLLYSRHDLWLHYQRRYIGEHGLLLYDINDERQHFSRRY